MEFKIDLEKLTEEQLEALRKINNSVVETEIKRRKETTYSQEDIKNNKIYADLYRAYFYIKPMYDNMRNTDVKKTLTQSKLLPVLEKIFHYADSHGYKYEKIFQADDDNGCICTDSQGKPIRVAPVVQESTPIEKAIEEATPIPATLLDQTGQEPTLEPGGGAEVEKPTPVATPIVSGITDAGILDSGIAAPVTTECADPGIAAPVTTECVDPGIAAPIDEIITSPVEKMSTEELNKILANIPTVEKI